MFGCRVNRGKRITTFWNTCLFGLWVNDICRVDELYLAREVLNLTFFELLLFLAFSCQPNRVISSTGSFSSQNKRRKNTSWNANCSVTTSVEAFVKFGLRYWKSYKLFFPVLSGFFFATKHILYIYLFSSFFSLKFVQCGSQQLSLSSGFAYAFVKACCFTASLTL